MNQLSTEESSRAGFSIVELMVAMTVLVLMLGLIFQLTKGTADIWKNSTGKTEGFRDARAAFEAMTREMSQATLTTYFDYVDQSYNFRTNTNFTPFKYARRSDLHFICGNNLLPLATSGVTNAVTQSVFFQAPLGYASSTNYVNMDNLLNACGFYVSYGPDISKPNFLGSVPDRNRFRLMQFTQPSEALMIYDPVLTGGTTLNPGTASETFFPDPNWRSNKWFLDPLKSSLSSTSQATISQLAENVVALVILPKNARTKPEGSPASPDDPPPLTDNYGYDSRFRDNLKTLHQLPPVVQVVMVIIDEASAIKLGNSATPPDLGVATLFQDPTKLKTDLAILEKNLGALPGNTAGNKIPLRYEVFQSEVAIRGAKWSDTY